MEFIDEKAKVLQLFVPQMYQENAKNFCYYLRTLSEGKYEQRYYSMGVDKNGLEIFDYTAHYAPTTQLTWNAVERLIKAEYARRIAYTPQMELHFKQLDNAF